MIDLSGAATGEAPGSHPPGGMQLHNQGNASPIQDDFQNPLGSQIDPPGGQDIILDSDSDSDEDSNQSDHLNSNVPMGPGTQCFKNPIQPRT